MSNDPTGHPQSDECLTEVIRELRLDLPQRPLEEPKDPLPTTTDPVSEASKWMNLVYIVL